MSAQEARETDINVIAAGDGGMFMRFADNSGRRVELLNEADARDLHQQLGEVLTDE